MDGITRRDADTIAIQLLPGLSPSAPALQAKSKTELLLHGFSFNGDPVPTSKLHFHQLSPGVIEITSLAYSLGDWEFAIADRADFYGCGEHFDTLNRAHTVVRNASQDNGGSKGSSTYKPMPFFMSTNGYGLWVDTTAEATFDFNTARLGDVAIEVPTERFRLVVFLEPEFPRILEQFTKLTQRAVVPPPWAFAPWMGRKFPAGDAQVRQTVDHARELGLPGSVLLMDAPWTTSYNSYKFGSEFADPAGDVKDVHAKGYKLVLWHTPWINSKSDPPGEPELAGTMQARAETYNEAAAGGYFVRRPDGTPWVGRWWMGEGSLIDFTNPTAKLWWQEQLRHAIATGADGFKNDDGEGNFQGDARFADGTPKELMRNRYATLYNNAVQDVITKDLKGNGVLFARSVTTGANGTGFVWGGDNESSFSPENGLPSVVLAGLSAGMSGIPLWTSDIGGYIDSLHSRDAALLARWTEFAAFSPVMEVFSSTNLLPWEWPASAFAVYRRYAALHMSLFPYRYAAAQEAAATGMPILRALPLLYQNDPDARTVRDEYLFGPELLVAPVTDANTRRAVYLPKGEWVDFWTGATVSGGCTIVVDVPTETIPVFARAGAVLPEIPDDIMTLVPAAESGNRSLKTLDDRRVYEVFPGAESKATTAKDFEERTVIRTGHTLTITGERPAHVMVRLRFQKVRAVAVNGVAAKVQQMGDASIVDFNYTGNATVTW